MVKKTFLLLIFLTSFLTINQSMNAQIKKNKDKHSIKKITKAVAVINPTQGNKVSGLVTFTKVKNGIKVVADIEGLTLGKHGFHIHQFGDCSDPKGKSAGGHFNPDGVKHTGHNSAVRHVGDFGNLTADKDGKAHIEFIDNLISFYGPNNIIGRGIIIHGGADDFKSQPSGNAGPRVACGAIALSK
ncbi:MAG: superoxide dismutase family protein [Bacteroidetes bacterium]|nr:superoxide dismutase family protein [Bacteroidota bacterium]